MATKIFILFAITIVCNLVGFLFVLNAITSVERKIALLLEKEPRP